MNHTARAVLLVYKEATMFTLLRETGKVPIMAWLNRIQDRPTIRTATVDCDHPLIHRWNTCHMRWIR